MAAEQFVVDVAWLDGMTGHLGGAADAARQALEALKETGPKRTGHKDLDKACLEYHDKWDDHVDDLAKLLDATRRAVDVARTKYASTEHTDANSFTPMPDTPPPAGSALPAAAHPPARSAMEAAMFPSPPQHPAPEPGRH